MSFDTRYRPTRYEDVLGQDATVSVLRRFVHTGSGFHQSYLFCGSRGSGKTTLGRILARALLCENPQDGNPCDQCTSCRSILENGSSECFSEQDAATKSGKENILKITEDLDYATFSGKRRLYLFDEAHQLSRQSLDALLIPLETDVSGTQDKKLVCIFCTTEPEKMRATIFSRCAPAFVIKMVPPEKIADRLAWICGQEKIQYEHPALVAIAESVECHIRDAIKAVEGVSMLGPVNLENVRRYLKTDVNDILVQIISCIGSDIGKAMALSEEVCQRLSPTTIYERLAEISMLAYKVRLGIAKPPSYWDAEAVIALGKIHGDFLVGFAGHLANRPGKSTSAMLALDVARLHQMRVGKVVIPQVTNSVSTEVTNNGISVTTGGTPSQILGKVQSEVVPPINGKPYETPEGRYIDPRGIKRVSLEEKTEGQSNTLGAPEFRRLLTSYVTELRHGRNTRGPTRRDNLGSAGTNQGRGTTG